MISLVWKLLILAAGTAVAWVLLKYMCLPLLIRRRNTVPISPAFQEFDPAAVPDGLAGVVRDIFSQLAALGFRAIGNLRRENFNRIVGENYLSVWVHDANADTARIIIALLRSVARFHLPTVVFIRHYADGSRLVTSNKTTPQVFPIRDNVDAAAVPGVRDLSKLYAFHRARLRQAGEKPTAPMPDRQGACAYVVEDMTDQSMHHARAGCFALDPAAGVWRLTLKGAYLMTWRALWPWKQLIRRRQQRELVRQVRELGLADALGFSG
jgi:hypothetical protein